MLWKIKLADGKEADVTHEEAMRLAKLVGESPEADMKEIHQRNQKYLCKAIGNVKDLTDSDDEPDDEDKLKRKLYENLPFNRDQADLLYEIMEAVSGMHTEKIMGM